MHRDSGKDTQLTEPDENEDQAAQFEPDKEPKEQNLKHLGGSEFDDFNMMLGGQTLRAMWEGNTEVEQIEKQRTAAIHGLQGIAPRDELEGMLAAQMFACHNAAMKCHRRAMIPDQLFEGRNANLSQANRLSRTYASLLEALNRHRGKGQQKMTVEHVHVHEGGQAIVGNVQQGGGADKKEKEQPHAKEIPHAPQPEMRREDTQRQPVPRTSDAKR